MKPAAVRWRLPALALAVLAAHLMLLRGAPPVRPAPQAAQTLRQQALITLTIALAPTTPTTPETPAIAVAPPQPQPVRRIAAPATPRIVLAQSPQEVRAPGAAPHPAPAIPSLPAAAAATAPVAAFNLPAPVRLHYRVEARSRGIVLQGQGELHWRHDGNAYEARLEVSAPLLPTRRQHSTGEITAAGLAPQRFSDKSRSEQAVHFQRDKGVVSFSNNQPDAPLAAGAQDRLSVLLQLGAMIAGDPRRYPPGTAIAVQTASTREAEVWHFTVEAEEQLRLPGGTVSALKLMRMPRREFDQTVELWLAPGMDYVPVRLRLTQPNGDWVDQQWVSHDKG